MYVFPCIHIHTCMYIIHIQACMKQMFHEAVILLHMFDSGISVQVH